LLNFNRRCVPEPSWWEHVCVVSELHSLSLLHVDSAHGAEMCLSSSASTSVLWCVVYCSVVCHSGTISLAVASPRVGLMKCDFFYESGNSSDLLTNRIPF
uniref:Uncharacterized protein n=1 Tax=Gadus morhua TaxID=8049 RepID=A0A8C5BTF6_GADMO